MKKSIVFLLLTVFSFSTVNAQKKLLKKLKTSAEIFVKNPLLVVLKSEDSNTNKLYNEFIIEATESEWYLNADFEFVDKNAFETMTNKKGAAFSYMIHETINGIESLYFGVSTEKKSFHQSVFDFNDDFKLVDIYLELQAAQFQIGSYAKMATDLKVSMKEMRTTMASEQEKKANIVKSNMLYIDKEDLGKGLENEISSSYKYDYKIVSREVIEKSILNNESNIYYLGKGGVISADTGEMILMYLLPNKLQVQVAGIGGKSTKISTKDFKEFIKIIN